MKIGKVIQVTPGIIPIPTRGWGAVEKIIWEYKLGLEATGYDVEILYADEVSESADQIVHVHMANLANLLHSRGIRYVFSLHDHHVEQFGKDSDCYRENYEAIKNAQLAFVHSPHLIAYFDSMPNVVYLQHGANTSDYAFVDRSESVRTGPSLMMMANNGLGGDPLVDRKGFLIGVDAARLLGLPITILCPGSNRAFFDHHAPEYDGLTVKYDVDYEQSIEELSRHSVFLNPSSIEAGHPNLTVVEALATGMPVVATSCVGLPGLSVCGLSPAEVAKAVSDCISRYDGVVESIRNSRDAISWDIVVTKMLQHYKSAFGVSEKEQLLWQYSSTRKLCLPKQEKSGIHVDFKSGRAFLKTSLHSEGLSAVFRDRRSNEILFETAVGKTPGNWAYMHAPAGRFVDWEVAVNFGAVALHTESMDLYGKKVLITGQADLVQARDFSDRTGCFVTLRDVESEIFCHDPYTEADAFYTVLDAGQLSDYFIPRPRKVDSHLLRSNSAALGDTIAFVPYAQRWAFEMNLVVDVDCAWGEIFDRSRYPNLRFVERDAKTSSYSHVWRFEYQFDRPLQRGYADQLGLWQDGGFEELPASVRGSGLKRPIKERYVCLGVQTTTQCKYWNRPNGWEDLCGLLAEQGIKVFAVDKHEVFGIDGHWNSLPSNAVKKVGMDFSEVIRYIEHCDAFIGVSSGLSWLAYGLGKQVVMVSGTTDEGNEFSENCRRVSPPAGVCSGCFNRPHLYRFDGGNWLWCPEHSATSRRFECTSTITPEMVLREVMSVI